VTGIFVLFGRDGGMQFEVFAGTLHTAGVLGLVRHCAQAVLCLLRGLEEEGGLRVVVVVRAKVKLSNCSSRTELVGAKPRQCTCAKCD
jgi:hypothetical protein